MVYDLMLPGSSREAPESLIGRAQDSHLWGFELKLDGIRAAATLERDKVTITSRNGLDMTPQFPEVVAALAKLQLLAVLDGEIIVKGADGRPDLRAVQQRNAQSRLRAIAQLAKVTPATFVAFDVLSINHIDVRTMTYAKRRLALERFGREELEVNPSSTDGQMMWSYVMEHNLEGLVLKRLDSRYIRGRTEDWIKLKAVKGVSALVCGYEPGKGHLTGTFGALKLALLDDDGQLRHVGSVGTGFTAAERRLIWQRLQRGGDDPIVVDVDYLEVTPNGHLRHPSFRGVRSDIPFTDCTVSQLNVHIS